ncbi:MAG: hypothetical protein DLM67_17990 [Candidatus Nephthysia bennettiae]|nr:MAG: hypothetical protein DLM67_17990 [Candidatus Dormibacteraeota bacterium]
MSRVIDAHVYLGKSIQGFGQDLDEVLPRMVELGVEMSILVPVRPPDYDYRAQNDLVAGARDREPGRFHALGRVDARLETAPAEAQRCLTELGLQGIYIHPWEDAISVSDPRIDSIVEVCAEQGTPLMVATGYPWVSEAPQIADLAGRFPNVPIVMTNGGQINISGMGQRNSWLAMEQHPNVYMTSSGVYREDFIEEVLAALGAGKVLFGSQSPLFDQDLELHRILWAHTDDPVKEAVMWDNAQKLFARSP